MDPIRIWFTDFWPGFDAKDNFILNAIPLDVPIVFDQKKPDIVFYSCFGIDHRRFECIRIFYTGENLRPNFNYCDYAIGFDYLNFQDRYVRFPIYMINATLVDEVLSERKPMSIDEVKAREFCNFVYSNTKANPERSKFFRQLNEKRHVSSLGRHLNNDNRLNQMADSRSLITKIKVMRKFNFSIAFENSCTVGYTAEKIFDAFNARTIPIYWGNPYVDLEFNPEAFINRHAFANDESCISFILELADDEEKMVEMLNKPVFAKGFDPYGQTASLSLFLGKIFQHSPENAKRREVYDYVRFYEKDTTPHIFTGVNKLIARIKASIR